MLRNLSYLILMFFIYSFAGWLMESVRNIFKEKKFVNRGFLIGPCCPIYGIGVLGITLLLTKYKDDIFALFILSTVICGCIEYFTSFIMEKLFKARWWDYHNRKFNINGRICLETLIPFGVIGTFIICIINPQITYILDMLKNNFLYIITTILTIGFIIDFIVSFRIILSFKGSIYNNKDNTEEISNKVRDKTEEIEEKIKADAETRIMRAESNAIATRRKIKAKALLFERKIKYTRNHTKENIFQNLQELSAKNDDFRKLILEKKEESTRQIIERFKKRSILSKRLMDAFPKLSIKVADIRKNKQKK